MLVLNKRQHKNFWAKIDKSGICWEWTASKNNKGYGLFGIGTSRLDNVKMLSHRISYMIKKGDIPEGLHIDHLCRNITCVNPDHLEAVTQRVNNQRQGAAVTHCPYNHELTPDNLVPMKGRRCRICHNYQKKDRKSVV